MKEKLNDILYKYWDETLQVNNFNHDRLLKLYNKDLTKLKIYQKEEFDRFLDNLITALMIGDRVSIGRIIMLLESITEEI